MKWSSICKKLPSLWIQRMILGTIVLVLLGLIGYEFWKAHQAREQEREQGLQVQYLDPNTGTNQQDSDGDGVLDWEEYLWGLNPQIADSDGDGVNDREYLLKRKEEEQIALLGLEEVTANFEQQPQADQIGQSLYTFVSLLQESGQELDEASQAQISDNIAEYLGELTIASELYVRDDLNLVANTQAYSYAYRDKLNQLLESYSITLQDIEILIQSVETQAAYETRIRNMSREYDELVQELIIMEVPYAIAGRHTQLTNNINQIAGLLKNLDSDDVDEIVTLSGLSQMEKFLINIQESLVFIRRFFEIIEDESVFETMRTV